VVSTTAVQVKVTATAVNDAMTGSVSITNSTSGVRGIATAQQGDTLSAGNTLADVDGLGSVTYKWQRGGVDISSATSSTYTLVQADVGAVITVTATQTDSGGTVESKVSSGTNAIVNVNDAPSGANKTITVLEEGSYTFAASDFGFADPNDSPANSLTAVKIATLPAVGTLRLSGVAVTAGQSIPAASLGSLVYAPAANGAGAGYASFTFQVQDNGGTAKGGVDLDHDHVRREGRERRPGRRRQDGDGQRGFELHVLGLRLRVYRSERQPREQPVGGKDRDAACGRHAEAQWRRRHGWPVDFCWKHRESRVRPGCECEWHGLRELHVPGAGQRRHGEQRRRSRPECQHDHGQRDERERRSCRR
jgi:hypothetical protein